MPLHSLRMLSCYHNLLGLILESILQGYTQFIKMPVEVNQLANSASSLSNLVLIIEEVRCLCKVGAASQNIDQRNYETNNPISKETFTSRLPIRTFLGILLRRL
jgi:hypothetical protein